MQKIEYRNEYRAAIRCWDFGSGRWVAALFLFLAAEAKVPIISEVMMCRHRKEVKDGSTLDNSYQVVKRGGKVTSVNGLPNPTLAAERDIEIKYSQGFMTIEELANAVKLYAEGKLSLTIDKKYSFDLEGIKQAHHDFEYGHNKGKKIIVFE